MHDVVFGRLKNLLNIPSSMQSLNGITAQVTDDSQVILDGTASADIAFTLPATGSALETGTYTSSLTKLDGDTIGTITVKLLDGNQNLISEITSASPYDTFSASGQTIKFIKIMIPSGTVCTQYIIGLQVEAGSTATGWVSPDAQGVIFGAVAGESGALTNNGNADAYPVIRIKGACSMPRVTNLTTGETVSANISLGDDDELVIDCRPDTCGVYLNGVANIGIKQGTGWIHCIPGDNVFSFARNTLENKRHCAVELQSRWI